VTCRLCSCVNGSSGRFLGAFLLQQRQRIRCIEGILSHGLLRGLTIVCESDVDPAIAGQNNHSHMLEHPLPIFRTKLGIALDRVLHLSVGKIFLFPESLGLDVGIGNAECDQETFRPLHSPLRKCLPKVAVTVVFGHALAAAFGGTTETTVGAVTVRLLPDLS
jgi:hypothetical protein